MSTTRTSLTLGALAAGTATLTGCAATPEPVGMANPASVYCVEVKKGRLEPRRDAQGNEYALCHLPDGTVVEEWELFRRENPAPAK